MTAAAREAVLLLHGLWTNHFVMSGIALALTRAGYAPCMLDYRSMRGTLAEHLDRIEERVAALPCARPHLIGHSMGGVLALAWLTRQPAQRPFGRNVLLGAPVSGCRAVEEFARHSAGRWLLGRSLDLWRDPPALAVPPDREIGAIAGTHAFGLGPLFVNLPGISDGVTRVDETRIDGLADHIELPVSHTGMLFSAAVARCCVAFLQHGRFQP